MKTGLKRTTKHVHLVQSDGLQIDRTIWTDGKDEFVKINGFVFNLWTEIDKFENWTVDFVW